MSTTPEDLSLEYIVSDDATEEEIEAYNESKEKEFEQNVIERRKRLSEQEQQAVDALVGDAKKTIETETVVLDSGLELEVRTRIPTRVERMQAKLERLEQRDVPVDQQRTLNCRMLAELVETEGYDSPDPWLIASQDDDAGMQWLSEVTATVLEPVVDRAEATKGKLQR